MGLTLTLTDTELPASPAFIEFLHATITGGDYHVGTWYLQQEELLDHDGERFEGLADKVRAVMQHPQGTQAIMRSYRFFKEMLTGKMDTLRDLRRFHFIFVIGIPRTGGTYLTKQFYRAAGIDYTKVQNALAHDGFPHLATLSFPDNRYNVHTTSLLQLAEYLTMVEIYFTRHGRLAYQGGIVVPKKFTKAVYNFPLIRALLGAQASFLFTVRHPLAVIQSVLDKSGGMPENERFAVRSAIERWALDDWTQWQVPEAEVMRRNYVDVMLQYWKRFHFQAAMSGILAMTNTQVVPYTPSAMSNIVVEYYRQFGIALEPEPFKTSTPPHFPDKEAAAQQVINEVEQCWHYLGSPFPTEALAGKS